MSQCKYILLFNFVVENLKIHAVFCNIFQFNMHITINMQCKVGTTSNLFHCPYRAESGSYAQKNGWLGYTYEIFLKDYPDHWPELETCLSLNLCVQFW